MGKMLQNFGVEFYGLQECRSRLMYIPQCLQVWSAAREPRKRRLAYRWNLDPFQLVEV